MQAIGFRGNVEVLSGRYVRGWCASKAGDIAAVQVYVNDVHRLSVPALKPRKDLQERGFSKSGGGFEIDVSMLLGFGDNTIRITDPDGKTLPNGQSTLSYSNVVFGDTAHHATRGESFSIGIYGNRYLATDPHVGSVLGKILTLLETRDLHQSDGSEHCNIWFTHPHLPKPQNLPRFINGKCSDISKSSIDTHHYKVFGRGVCMSPFAVELDEIYVVKSEENAAHDGKTLKGREVSQLDLSGSVLQRLIDNRIDDDNVYDIRVPVIGNKIPFVYIKTRPMGIRFSNANATATITAAGNYLSEDEIEKILQFSRAVGLDYGELDVLRDAKTQEIFVVDVNNTPSGPPNGLTANETMHALREMSWAFASEFLSPGDYWKSQSKVS